MSGIYDTVNGVDKVEDENTYPETQTDDKQRPSNPAGEQIPSTVDYFQLHPLKDQFNDPNGLLSVYDPDNPDRQLMDIIETEMISLSAPPCKYYKLVKTHQNLNPVYGEATRRDYSDPVVIYGSYEDPSPEQELTQWGLQELEEIEMWFNYNHLLQTIGDQLHIGDILQTYDAKLWEVMTSVLIDEAHWRTQHNKTVAKKLSSEGIYLPDAGDITKSPNLNALDSIPPGM